MSTKEKYLNPFTDFDFKTAEIAKFNKKERGAYEDSLKQYRDIKNVVDTAQEKGEKIGKEKRSIEIAKNLLVYGLSIEIVSENTNLSIEEVQKIANSIKK